MQDETSDNDTVIPRVAPVPSDVHRPFWSVMIPTYNCSHMLETALRSVLDQAQDTGPDQMQIGVVDDHSTNGVAQEIVEKVAPTRVEFYRQPSNVGLAANWNTCISRSRGQWIHVLHQDDEIRSGFYKQMAEGVQLRGDIGAGFCRHIFMDGDGHWISLRELEQKKSGVLEGWLEKIAISNRIQCPAMVVKREAYEKIGGFRTDLVYALDWEMWVRLACRYAMWYEPGPLACYRKHDANETSRLFRTAEAVDDLYRAVEIMYKYIPAGQRDALRAQARRWCGLQVVRTARALLAGGERQAAWRQLRRVRKHDRSCWFYRKQVALYIQSLGHLLRRASTN